MCVRLSLNLLLSFFASPIFQFPFDSIVWLDRRPGCTILIIVIFLSEILLFNESILFIMRNKVHMCNKVDMQRLPLMET